ncbi:MAG: Asp-tRNA(Asn)/Glu-tRNA(Gln) amidotransferase GatCAB subunit C [Rickettsiales bacterium]|nr:Asp-tRNA(Asn)/Glu-tRNA(Gln) amidotransferase GatCAB subunit C [Rickettsiales bacterium]|tara:strand:- start:122 stop:412 length:291 start_codon:yes stop_codon:yes gene_type:complete
MSEITKQTVQKLGRLSRIRIEEGEEEHLANEVTGILGWIEQLGEVDTDGVEAMTGVSNMPLKEREDVVNDGGKQQDVLSNAPETTQGYFVVPKIVE